MQILDLHCDTAWEMLKTKQDLRKNRLQLDLERMEAYDGYIQVFAAFVDQKQIRCSPMNHCLQILHYLQKELAKNNDGIRLIRTAKDLEEVKKQRKLGAILSLEGGEALEGNLSALWMYYQLGVRLITLTWNHANELADGIMEPRGGGLTAFGKEAVKMMEELGILIDVSHLSEQGFWDVVSCTSRPFVASHSCVKQLCNHPRNLTDEQISCLIQRRGGIGINFFPEFLTESKSCNMEHILDHVAYILDLGGMNTVGLGSDFDGVSKLPEGMQGVEDVCALVPLMEKRNWSKELQEKILFGNFYKILQETWKECV